MHRVTVERLARILGRGGSVLSILLLALFLFAANENAELPIGLEALGLVLFPGGVVAGMLIGWRNEFWGGVLTLVSLVLFYGWHLMSAGGFPKGPYFILFSVPGLLFLIAGLTGGSRKDSGAD